MDKNFILDTNAFIEPKNQYYGFEICPGYWAALIHQHTLNRVCSIDRIADELKRGDDALKEWVVETAPSTFFKSTDDQAVIDRFQDMVRWVYNQDQFTPAAKAQFASVADGWLIAYAAVNNLVVVTHEVYSADIKRAVKIPNVCVEFDVECVHTFSMLRTLEERFVRNVE